MEKHMKEQEIQKKANENFESRRKEEMKKKKRKLKRNKKKKRKKEKNLKMNFYEIFLNHRYLDSNLF